MSIFVSTMDGGLESSQVKRGPAHLLSLSQVSSSIFAYFLTLNINQDFHRVIRRLTPRI